MNKYDGSKGPPDINGMASLKVDNLTYRTTMDDLERYFKKYGEVGDIYIPRDRDTHESRGFAFVRFYEERDADDAMDAMDGKVIDGREIRVAMARYGRPTNQYDPHRAGGGNRYRGGYRDRGGSSSYHRDGDSRNSYRERRRSPRRRRSRSRSRSPRRRSRSHSRSPRDHKRSSSRSPKRRSKSPERRSKSPERHSKSPERHSKSPAKSRSISRSKSRSRSRSRSKSFHSRDG